MRHIRPASLVILALALTWSGPSSASQTPKKPVRTFHINAAVNPADNEPSRLYADASAVVRVRVDASQSRLQRYSGPGHAETVITEHQVTVLEVLKDDPFVRTKNCLVVQQRAGQVDAGEYIVKTEEQALDKGEWILFLHHDAVNGMLTVDRAAQAFRIRNGKISTGEATSRAGADAETVLKELRALKASRK